MTPFKRHSNWLLLLIVMIIQSCIWVDNKRFTNTDLTDSIADSTKLVQNEFQQPENAIPVAINPENATPQQIVSYAETLIGVPYVYGSSNPEKGFDCSGFITYVFNHFNIAVPRSSVEFTNVGQKINLKQAEKGDLILFTGTDSTIRVVGHMGIITSNPGEEIKFIHSTSGRAMGVTITPLNKYYQGRFVKVIRIFDQKN